MNWCTENKIEILIDTISLTYPDRTGILNNRVCPLQISWLAYCNTLGFDTIDYLVADKYVIKNGEEKYYKERIFETKKWTGAYCIREFYF